MARVRRAGQSIQQQPATPRQRWFRIGPGAVLALIAGYFILRSNPDRFQPARQSPPVRPGRTSMTVPAPPAAPEVAFLLEKRHELTLTPGQIRTLTAIERQWQRDTAALREALDRSASVFHRRMQEQGGKGQTLARLEEEAAAVSDYSRQLYAARRTAWQQAARQLTAAQRQRAETLWNEKLGGWPLHTP
jgi:hypothetical protein